MRRRDFFRRGIGYTGGLVGIGVIYFALAKGGLALASINPSATPIWPPTGFTLAAVLLWGYRTWPAIFAASLIVNATTAGSIATAIAIATGNSLEAVVGAYLINRWSNGRHTFSTPSSVAKFALICVVIATPISPCIGVTSLATAGYTEWTNFANIWVTWWLGDVTSALVVTPVIVLWALSDYHAFNRNEFWETVGVLATAVAVGLIAFSPLIEQTPSRDPLGFLAILPLLWAALRRGPRDTATVALVLSGITIWGTLKGAGPFATANLNVSLLLLVMFFISITVPSLLLSADVAVRKKAEENMGRAQIELERKVVERTQELELANAAKSRFPCRRQPRFAPAAARFGLIRRTVAQPSGFCRSGSNRRAHRYRCRGNERTIQRTFGYLQARRRGPYGQSDGFSNRAPAPKTRGDFHADSTEKGIATAGHAE
jgi:integral membrane sensor domain MASE1